MKKGLPAKFLLIPGVIIFLIIVSTFGPQFFPDESEYQKDRTRLREVMAGKLPENSASQIKLPIQGYLIPGAAGWCLVDAAAGIANYLEPDIDFDKFVLLDNPTLVMAARNKNERYGTGMSAMRAFINLGYTPLRGVTSPIHPPQNVSMDIEPQNFIYFKTKEEELVFIKRLLSAGIAPIVTIIQDPFEPIGGGAFVSLIGYDQRGVWLNVSLATPEKYAQGRNFMNLPERYEPRFLTYDQFFKFWTPDHQFFWVVKTGSRKPEEEIYTENKKNAREAPANLRKTVEFLKGNGDLQLFTAASDAPTAAALYRYFQKKGASALANQYLEMAKTYVSMLANPPTGDGRQIYIKTLEAVSPYYTKAALLWP